MANVNETIKIRSLMCLVPKIFYVTNGVVLGAFGVNTSLIAISSNLWNAIHGIVQSIKSLEV